MLEDSLAELELENMISGAVTNPATINALLNAFQLAMTRGRPTDQMEKRTPAPTCQTIPDEQTCIRTDEMCKTLRRCMWTQNYTTCIDFGYKAVDLCNTQNF
jgi:hypothetical protein